MSNPTSRGSKHSSNAPRILVDRCISSSFAAVLRKTGLDCSSLAEVFGDSRAQQMQDEELLGATVKIDAEAIRKRLARASAKRAALASKP